MPSDEIVNRSLVPDNACFGCGHDNPLGLGLEIRRDGERGHRLVGTLRPQEHHSVFPGITHGGVIFTAFGCLAGWVPTALRPEEQRIWVLRSASRVTFHRPARTGQTVTLTGSILREGTADEPMVVQAEAHDPDGQLLAEGEFTLIPLRGERFERVGSGSRLTPGWLRYLAGGDPPPDRPPS